MMKRGATERSAGEQRRGEQGRAAENGNAAWADKLESQKVEGLSEAHRLSAVLVIHEAVNCQLSKKRRRK